MFEVPLVEFSGHRVGGCRFQRRCLGCVLFVGGDEGRFFDRLDEQRVPADDPDVALFADDAGDPGGVVVVLLVIQGEQRLGERVAGRVAEFEFLGDRIDLRAVPDDGVFARFGRSQAVLRDVGVVRLRGLGGRDDGKAPVSFDDLPVRERTRGDAVGGPIRRDDDEASDVHARVWWR